MLLYHANVCNEEMKTKLNKLLEQVSYGLIDIDIQNINELLDYG